ncbi:protein-glucosylgalactosylhydroxylysine glucosidase isoform X2 [Polypterus senegalus]|uniref:protein-glucosylgalactosylhydroxylysine glucosidase isoform X2 n=1 Tax=Polypterus senegalus TaxID=55291 RepID=UPI001963427B|nr:protein-glucosylgalactosylhydroxylysine glucosidase isoform X2 [Polypterus senegalus]
MLCGNLIKVQTFSSPFPASQEVTDFNSAIFCGARRDSRAEFYVSPIERVSKDEKECWVCVERQWNGKMTEDDYIFTSDKLPSDPRYMATVSNGFVGTRIFDELIHVNGVYNGGLGDCHRANIPSPLAVRINMNEISQEDLQHSYTLDTLAGWFTHTLSSDDVIVTQKILAHRVHLNLLVMEIIMERKQTPGPSVNVQLLNSFSPQSQDIAFTDGPDFQDARYIYGQILIPEVKDAPKPSIHLIWTPVPTSLTLPEGKTSASWVFLIAVAETADQAKDSYSNGLALIASGKLCSSHKCAWAELWSLCGIRVAGLLALNQVLIGCVYYLLSALPPLKVEGFLFNGISPGGLSNGKKGEDYWGHVFWDQGVKFAWESALTGEEMCPEEIYGQKEIHINGDVCFAFQQYLYATGDLSLFREEGGWALVQGIAEYWVSRVTWNTEHGWYEIKGVMPPDEYHVDVDNSVYTNVVAKYSLEFAVELAQLLQIKVPKEWQEVGSKIKVPFDLDDQYHPEFDGFQKGETVKQADVVLLGFPLGYPMTEDVRRNDLEFYEPLTDQGGPSMTWGMFAVGWLELKQKTRAQAHLMKCFSNIQEPYKVWSEYSDGTGAVNFLTGMGGFLQAVLFGYTGFRIKKESLNFDPALPEEIMDFSITGVCYLGNKLNFTFKRDKMTITLDKILCLQHFNLEVALVKSGETYPLNLGKQLSIPIQPGRIQKRVNNCWPL